MLALRAYRRPPATLLGIHGYRLVVRRTNTTLASTDGAILNDTKAPETNDPAEQTRTTERGSFFVDTVLPARYAEWDIRTFLYDTQEAGTTERLKRTFSKVTQHNFTVLGIELTTKDGGAFVKFGYTPQDGQTPSAALEEIKATLKDQLRGKDAIHTWHHLGRSEFHEVKGKVWTEDLSIFPTNILKIEFEGPDVHQELLYELLRPYGRITSITKPTPQPAGTLRFVTVTYSRIRSAILARNCLYGIGISDNTLSNAGTATAPTKTRLVFTYERPIKAHFIRDWISSHPRIVLPVVAFLLGTITYTIFDPIRSFFVQGKMLGYFDYHEWRIVKFFHDNVYSKVRFSITSATSTSPATKPDSSPTSDASQPAQQRTEYQGIEWKERQDAERSLFAYLADKPTTIAVIHGPQGSGKTKMVAQVLAHSGLLSGEDGSPRKTIEIDCAEIYKAGSDPALITSLARQTGYWPVFSFLSSMNNMIDLASVGLIGQKAGFSTTVNDQIKEILEVTGGALKQVSVSLEKRRKKAEKAQPKAAEKASEAEPEKKEPANEEPASQTATETQPGGMESLKRAADAASSGINAVSSAVTSGVAGAQGELQKVLAKTGIIDMSEKVEQEIENEWGGGPLPAHLSPRLADQSIATLPVVVIRNFATKGAAKKDELLDVIAEWAASLVENRVAHVIVISDNRENMRKLAKALPTRPLLNVPLGDADAESAMSLVRGRISATHTLSKDDETWVEHLGGRASDLDELVRKVQNGASVRDAVQEIVAQGVGELRKAAFGDDEEDAKDLAWKPEQAWGVLKQLAKKDEISYADVLLEFPFKGDEAALRGMEHAELISITTQDGLPVSIKPGRPVYRYVFQRLVNDDIFRAVQDIAYNNKAIATEEATIKKCEDELMTLRSIGLDTGSSFFGGSGATASRASYLLAKMKAAEERLEAREKDIKRLKKLLSQTVSAP